MNTTFLLHRPTAGSLPPQTEPEAPTTAPPEVVSAEPSWAKPAFIALLLVTAFAYLWDLSGSGYANSFYSAAVEAGTKSWKAFFFGSLDSSNFITVDKPPASLWVMALSGRIFGFSSWSMLVPQALEGVAAVALLYSAIRRWFGPGAGLLAGALFALTPVAALMFRFNNPDALLICLLVASAYCLTRALEHAKTKWVVVAGTMIGFAFLAKMMQAFLVLPAFGLVYMLAAPTGLRRRITQLLGGAVAIVISGGWWVAIVALWPASSRPFIDGSPDNNIFNLITGYNGLGRIFGSAGAPGGGGGAAAGTIPGGGAGGGGPNFSGATGLLRLFNDLMGGQASWLLPAALISLVIGLWSTRRMPRTDRTRAALLLWGGWLIVSGLVFSFSTGVIHTYYTVALAPAIAALVAITGSLLWQTRGTYSSRVTLALLILTTAAWSWALLDRTPQWEAWLRPLIIMSAALALIGLFAAPTLKRFRKRLPLAVAAFALIACMTGPVAYSAQTITTAHKGSLPEAGPSSGAGGFGPGGFGKVGPGGFGPGGSRTGGPSGFAPPTSTGTPGQSTGGVQLFGSSQGGEGPSGAPIGGSRASSGGVPGGGVSGIPGGSGPGRGDKTTVSSALKKALETEASRFRWVAAVSGSENAASLELAIGGEPVMAIGGFNNQGGKLTLAQFKQYVAKGNVHYYIASGGGGGAPGAGGGAPGGGIGSSAITSWVKAHFKSSETGGQTLYDLTQMER